jgi:hypothetical protein
MNLPGPRALRPREAVLSALLVFAVALVARIVAASLVVFPKPEDTAYYVEVARNLIEGRALVADALWSYQTPPLTVPREAFEVWLPLPTFLAAIPMVIAGTSFAAAQVSSVIVGALVPVLAWRLAADVAQSRGLTRERSRTLAIGSGLTAAVSLPLLLHSALPDSTMPFAALTLGSSLLMTRILAAARNGEAIRPGGTFLLGLGVLLGLAALTRNEAAWLALAWALLAWFTVRRSRRERLVLIAVPAVVSLAIFAPWAIRDWIVFGSPMPGQALTNALSVSGTDIFAWSDPPTISRYLAVGPAALLEMRLTGLTHNLFNVLLLPGAPLSFVGLVALPWVGRDAALRPLLVVSIVTFLVTSLAFPVATTWGTFLHASAAIQVLLIVAALVALDALLAAIGRRRGWTKPVAWLAPVLTGGGALLFSYVLLPGFGAGSEATAKQFAALDRQMTAAGMPFGSLGPVITDYPVWLSYTTDANGLALPAEPPASVVDLARAFPGTKTVVVLSGNGVWPQVLEAGGPGSECFEEVDIGRPAEPDLALAIEGTRVFRVVCP